MRKKNQILKASLFFALGVMCVSAFAGFATVMIIALAYLLFMLVNNWEYVVGKKISKEELEDAKADFEMIHLFKRDET